jgi:XTP/dITP diphosphohydrolase
VSATETERSTPQRAPASILIATRNAGKAKEFAEMLGGDGVTWRDLASLKDDLGEVEETGTTFRANACLKASAYAKRSGLWTVADDSGLEVDALGGSPGVYSARWAARHEAGSGDADNNRLLLKQLADIPDDKLTARFVCVLALADEEGRIVLTARDTVEGRIIRDLRGSNGFGYDPLFLVDAFGRTTAELSPEQKHAVSHRGKALRRLKRMLGEVMPGVTGQR